MTRAYVGLGANLGNPRETVSTAMLELERLPGSTLTGRSRLYRSAPLGVAPQPDFINAVLRFETSLEAAAFLDELHRFEERYGRRRPFPGAPRTLDLDLLLHGETAHSSARLTIPHPRMHLRAFVLRPLLDLDPAISIPGKGAASVLLAACGSQAAEPLD